ncbi:MAG TPA: branched-chain amino acid ABC transporter permease [Acidimicrobiales bacterium]|nr:branched-chain amino acid ABC transporter permease [Acidimicrobiales bacterium]
MNTLLESIGFGVVTASIIAIAAMGFSLQFALTNVFNVAYGAVLTVGAFTALITERIGANPWVGLATGAALGIVVTVLIGKGVFVFFARRGNGIFELVMVSLALELIIQYGIQAFDHEQVYNFAFHQGTSVKFGAFVITATQFVIIGIAVVAFALLEGMLRFTKLGKALRAVAEEPRLARACGISTGRVVNVAWIASGALAGLAGVAYVVNSLTVTAFSGTDFLPLVLAAAILGRAGSVAGAVLASLAIGIVIEVVSALGGSAYSTVAGFGILVIVLLVKPGGVIGQIAAKTEVTL